MKTIQYVVEEIDHYLDAIVSGLPGRSGMLLRSVYYRRKFRKMGDRTFFSTGCILRGHQNISLGCEIGIGSQNQLLAGHNTSEEFIHIGDRTKTNSNVIFNADIGGRIIVGEDVLIGPNTVIRASNHRYKDKRKSIFSQGHTAGSIIIGNDVWISANVTILPDVTIGIGAVIGAGAVVNRDIEPYTIAAGVPAKKVGERM